ncbi:hypothetical protein A1507_01030 [Methylomonas koyamae]|uniref:Uncharacterized protein n=1 Tax=Methylomonas koyamae TaxID=702114 RepID=A0A177N9W7_9GAMM|nr:hypothetical protein A1507_01030 [Methylomonas koyamae]
MACFTLGQFNRLGCLARSWVALGGCYIVVFSVFLGWRLAALGFLPTDRGMRRVSELQEINYIVSLANWLANSPAPWSADVTSKKWAKLSTIQIRVCTKNRGEQADC